MDKQTRLNLGCGSSYRPGYVNVDLFDRSVADSFSDVENLSYEPASVDEIVADQLIEHFDLVHCRYLLAAWFRMLRPGGRMVLETPDLEAALRKLVKSRPDEQASTLQWLYGIDSPGLQHKGGFTFDILKRVLIETGFEKIERKPALTHRYEPGLRVECRKPQKGDDALFIADLRVRLRESLNLSDSFVMTPLEDWIDKIRSLVVPVRSVDLGKVRHVIKSTASCNPKIPHCVIQCLVDGGRFKRSELKIETDLLNDLVGLRFHERAFSLWTKSRRSPSTAKEFESFHARLGKTVSELMEHSGDRENALAYISSLEPRPIELLDLRLVERQARISLGVGVRKYSEWNLEDALDALLDSVDLDPGNPMTRWNLARVRSALGQSNEQVKEEYDLAASLMPEKRLQAMVKKEARELLEGDQVSARLGPISEGDMVAVQHK
jgi:predicted SAM-dependent methyltransferase